MNDEKLIGITAAARQIGISHSTLSRQVKFGQVRNHDGKVRVSEVLHDRDRNIDKSIWLHRTKGKRPKSGTGQPTRPGKDAPVHAAHASADTADTVVRTGQYVPLSSDLTQDLGRLLGSLSDDPVDVGTDCIMIGMEMLEEEARRLRGLAGRK